MWTAPDGSRHDSIPQRWRSAGRTFELAGAAALARRRGWVEDAVPAPAVPTLAELQAAVLERYRAEAAECLRRSLPAPWDVLRSVATVEYRAWADEFCALVAAELTRLEAAVAAAPSSEALAAIVADWPEVAE